MDVVAEYATPIPLTMIGELMAIPPGDRQMLVGWSHAMVRPFDAACTVEEGERAESVTREFVSYVEGLIRERRTHPGDDLLSALIEARDDGDRLTDSEIVATAILTLNAGHEATVKAIANAVLALATHPEAWRDIRARPDLAATAADELLRFDAPLQMFERWVLTDVEWDGVRLAQGSKVGLLFGAANRDPDAFEQPDDIVLDRSPNPHVSFGAGIHHCVGAPLARVEMAVALETLARRVARLELLDTDPPRTPSLIFRGPDRLEVALEA